ncbi:MAG: hypothetical protein WBG50_20025 [Desulfomonilaceae bacterium]
MTEGSRGFNMEQVLIETLKLLKDKGVLAEQEILDILWEAKDPIFPWTRNEIKELIKL